MFHLRPKTNVRPIVQNSKPAALNSRPRKSHAARRASPRDIAALGFALLCIGWGNPLADKTRQALRLYKQKKYDDALSKLADAQTHDPENSLLYFNIGDAHYRKGKYAEARKAFQKALDTSDVVLEAKAYYNIGNCLYRQGKLTESLDYYKRVIQLLTPSGQDEENLPRGSDAEKTRKDAQFNYELVQKKIKEMLNRQRERQQKQKGNKQQKRGNKKSPPRPGESQKRQNPQNQQKQRAAPPPQKKQAKQQVKPQPLPTQRKPMTKEQAERLLEALKREEQQLRKRMRRTAGGEYRVEKDW